MMELELETVDLKALLSSSLTIVREKAAAQRVLLDLEIAEGLGAGQFDARKLKQIVYNLLSNAVKFSASDGRVALRARRVPRQAVGKLPGAWPAHRFALAESEHAEFLEIAVTDSGIGISKENMAKLFQAFSQIDSSLARKFEGTGLGLAMVKLLAELHGGSVAVSGAEGKGACFAVWLPLRAAGAAALAAASALAPPKPPAARQRDRVALVVEDDERAADLIRLLLEAEGFGVLRAGSAEDALAMAPRQALSLITIDLQLPGLNGWELLEHLRKDPALASVPVVVTSGLEVANLGLRRGASAVLQKPISRVQLKSALASLGLHPEPAREHSLALQPRRSGDGQNPDH